MPSIVRDIRPEAELADPLLAGRERFVLRTSGAIVHQIGNADDEPVTVAGSGGGGVISASAIINATADDIASHTMPSGMGVTLDLSGTYPALEFTGVDIADGIHPGVAYDGIAAPVSFNLFYEAGPNTYLIGAAVVAADAILHFTLRTA